MYTKHRFTRQSLGKMFSSVHLIQHRAALGWLFGGGRAVGSACASNEVIANLIRPFVGATAEKKHLEMITTPHNSCG